MRYVKMSDQTRVSIDVWPTEESSSMTAKAKVVLTPEQETLLITLFAKGQPANPLFYDPTAQDLLGRVDYDFSQLQVPYKTVVLVCQRAKKIDRVTREFMAKNPGGVVLHLGCGLDSRFWRVDDGQVDWYDIDLPAVAELRRQFFNEAERYHLIESSVTEVAWMDSIRSRGRAVLVVAEGLLMYLDEADVRQLVIQLQEHFQGCRLIADIFSRLTARSASSHPSLKTTGATMGWGIDDAGELETWGPGIRLLEEWYFTDDPDLELLNLGYRMAYKLAGAFKVVQRAHRIVTYQL